MQNPRQCSCKDKVLYTVKDAKTLEEINIPDDHYLLPRQNIILGAVVGNGRHRTQDVRGVRVHA